MTMRSSIAHGLVFYLTLIVFGGAGLLLHAIGFLLCWVPATAGIERSFQWLISRSFAVLLAWTRRTGVCRVRYRGFDPAPTRGAVMVANHPGLLDATYLLAREPAAVCLFKGSIRRNPILGAARRAGYLANDGGLGLVRAASARLAAGTSLVVFPEGTRTPPGRTLGAFHAGFALIARRARAPIQLVRITSSGPLFAKGRSWWKLPRLPVDVVVQAGPRIDPATAASTDALVAQVEAWFAASATPRLAPAPAAQYSAAGAPVLTVS